MDEDGWFSIVDRKKDLIITGGENIYPREVEEVIFEHPKVKEVAVVGVPHPFGGEIAKAFVVLKPGETATKKDITQFAARAAGQAQGAPQCRVSGRTAQVGRAESTAPGAGRGRTCPCRRAGRPRRTSPGAESVSRRQPSHSSISASRPPLR